MFEKFELPTWKSLRDDELVQPNDFVEDLATGHRVGVGRSAFYKFLTGERAGQARQLPTVSDVVRIE